KSEGRRTFRRFLPEYDAKARLRRQLELDLRQALARGEFEVHYQPLVDLAANVVNGVEALLRWRHPERGMISPVDFIPIAEETGLIVPIGRWVLHEGCRHARRLEHVAGGRAPRMSINLSLKQLQHSDIVADVRAALEDSGLAPE